MMKEIYADHSATTPLLPQALDAMLPFLTEIYGNPSVLYSQGRKARKGMEEARWKIAGCLGASPDEIYFTSGGTESDNWAIKGGAQAMAQAGKRHIISTAFEHPAILQALEALKRQGYSVTLLPVEPDGTVLPDRLRKALRSDTGLVSVMAANNETGVLQPVEEMGQICREAGVLFHTDAVQAVGNLPFSLQDSSIDMLSLSGHKLGGPKGTGALYIRRGLLISNLIDGGGQESNRRSGTENVAGIVGLGAAMETMYSNLSERTRYITALRLRLEEGILKLPGTHLHGAGSPRLPGTSNIGFEGVAGSTLMLMLSRRGICCSTGSACSSCSHQGSHVLRAMGISEEMAKGSLRFSLGAENTDEDIQAILKGLQETVSFLRTTFPSGG